MPATDRINVFPLNNVPGTIVTLMDTSNVENVFVAGKLIKWHGKLVGVDLNGVRRTIEKSRDAVLARAGYSSNRFGTCCSGSADQRLFRHAQDRARPFNEDLLFCL